MNDFKNVQFENPNGFTTPTLVMNPPQTKPNYLINLTPLRGIAALLTVLYHIDLMLGNGGNYLVRRNFSPAMSRFYLMVDFFFILSGFIMCHVYGKWFTSGVSTADFKKFTLARFARVYPLHFITLLYVIALFSISAGAGIPKVPILETENSTYSVITNLLLLHSMNFHNWFSWNHASWSISTEWWAYMVFPFLVRPFYNLSKSVKGVVAVLCYAGYLAIPLVLSPLVTLPESLSFLKDAPNAPRDLSVNVAFQFGYVRCLLGFILGMMLYQGYSDNWAKKYLANGWVMVACFLGAILSMHLLLPDVVTLSFFPFILLAGAYGSSRINAFFANNALQKLGDWSFSIYLVHQPLLFTYGKILQHLNPPDPNFKPTGPPPPAPLLTAWLTASGVLALILLVSYLTYRFYEKPTRQWLNAKAA